MKSNMKLYAKRGNSIELYVPQDKDPNDLETQGVLLDIDSKKETPIGVQQALKWGYWEAVSDGKRKDGAKVIVRVTTS